MSITRAHLLGLLAAIAHVHSHPDPKGYVADVEKAWDELMGPDAVPADQPQESTQLTPTPAAALPPAPPPPAPETQVAQTETEAPKAVAQPQEAGTTAANAETAAGV